MQSTVQGLLASNDHDQSKENIVNRHTYILYPPTGDIPMNMWGLSPLNSFRKVLMPEPTIDGINRLLIMPLVRNNKNLRLVKMFVPLTRELLYIKQ